MSFDRQGKERFKGKTRNYPNHVRLRLLCCLPFVTSRPIDVRVQCRVGKYWIDWEIQGLGEHGCCMCCTIQ